MLETKNLRISINNKIICHDLNWQVNAGEVWGILGPNGSGKTTLLHTLAGLHSHFNGDIFIANEKIGLCTPKKIAQKIGILFQHFTETFSQTVWEYCLASRFPHQHYFQKKSAHDEAITRKSLALMELEPLAKQNIHHLSGGQKRRLAIACILNQTPHVFLLDEPNNHLDVRHQIQMLKHFCLLAETESKIVIMSLHDVNLAQQFCTHLLLIHHGGVIQQGRTEEIINTENLSKLYEHHMQVAQMWQCQ